MSIYFEDYPHRRHEACEICDKQDTTIAVVADYFVCEDCCDSAEDKTGYCSVSCQLGGGCDGSC